MSAKKRTEIDQLLRWAWRDELPKAQRATSFLRPEGFGFGWGAVARYGKYMADPQEPDIRNAYGVVPDFTAHSEPHPDARRLWEAVQELADFNLTIPADWNPIADLGDLAHYGEAAIAKALDRMCFSASRPEEAVRVNDRSAVKAAGGGEALALRKSAIDIVGRYAILGATPPWEAERPTFCTVKANGMPKWFVREVIVVNGERMEVEADGMNRRKRMPKAGAYLKHYYEPDPAGIVEERAEFEIWHAALTSVQEMVTGRLDEHEALPLSMPARPWEAGAPAAALILSDLRPVQPVIHRQRPAAGPPPRRGIARESTSGESENGRTLDFRRSLDRSSAR